MKNQIQSNQNELIGNKISHPRWRRTLLVGSTLACLGLSPTAVAVSPPLDGGYVNQNTAEGEDALSSVTTGGFKTATGPNALSSHTQIFTEVTTAAGFANEAKKSWGNPIWGDFNNDGFLDLVVPTHGLTFSGGPFVYLNNGNGTFTDIRTTCGIGQQGSLDDGDWHGFSFGDYDGDGNLDLYVSEGAKGNHGGTTKRDLLFRGGGNGTFVDASENADIEVSMNRGRCSAFFDYDNDGLLDLFVKNYAGANVLYKNNGDGTYAIVPNGGGLTGAASGLGNGSIVSVADYDNDGFMDVAITGDGNAQAFYKNMGNGTFVDVTAATRIKPRKSGQGLAWGDYNNDGLLDLVIARGHEGRARDGVSLYRNDGDGRFTDVTEAAGVRITASCWAAIWGDYDNDGLLDLFVTNAGDTGQGPGNANRLFHNNGNGTFTDVAVLEGVALQDNVAQHKGAAWADYDNNGFLDLLIKDGVGNAVGLHRLFKNLGNSNHFIKVNLVGTHSNIGGIGARVTATSANGLSFRQNNGGGGGEYASQGSEPLHFGIGAATDATVEVIWPSGIIDRISGVPADSTLTVTEATSPP